MQALLEHLNTWSRVTALCPLSFAPHHVRSDTSSHSQLVTFKRKVSDGPPNGTPARSKDFPAFQQLDSFLRLAHSESPLGSPSVKGKQKAEPYKSVPLVIVVFDEAYTTTLRQQNAIEEWSVFNELCHTLRRLHSLPFFSLFLSTTGKISQFTSAIDEYLSKRVVEGQLVIIQPYTDLTWPHCKHHSSRQFMGSRAADWWFPDL